MKGGMEPRKDPRPHPGRMTFPAESGKHGCEVFRPEGSDKMQYKIAHAPNFPKTPLLNRNGC